jgi:hypothetical protein
MFTAYNQKLTGTSGTLYVTAKVMPTGVVGYRDLRDGSFRVRVEPFNTPAGGRVALSGWYGPNGSNVRRFSTVVSASQLAETVVTAAKALKAAETVPVAEQVSAALSAYGF